MDKHERMEELQKKRKKFLENAKQRTDEDELKRIKAIFYGKRKDLSRTDTDWLIRIAEKALKNNKN